MNNFLIRTISGIIFSLVVIGAILIGPITSSFLLIWLMVTMLREYLAIAESGVVKIHNRTKYILYIGSTILYILSLLVAKGEIDTKYLLIGALLPIVIYISNLYVRDYNRHNIIEDEREENGYESFPFVISALIYIVLPFLLFPAILFNGGVYSGKILLSFVIILWCSDVGAYCLGSTLGQKYNHRLFKSISPKKSWEGVIGAIISSLIGGFLLNIVGLLQISLINVVVVAFIICIFGVWGDLVESQLKRNFGVKDSGKIMPGHGGMLDRFDGALIAFPVAIIYLLIFVN